MVMICTIGSSSKNTVHHPNMINALIMFLAVLRHGTKTLILKLWESVGNRCCLSKSRWCVCVCSFFFQARSSKIYQHIKGICVPKHAQKIRPFARNRLPFFRRLKNSPVTSLSEKPEN